MSDVNLVARTLAGNVEYILKAKYSITGERTQCEPAVLSSSLIQLFSSAVLLLLFISLSLFLTLPSYFSFFSLSHPLSLSLSLSYSLFLFLSLSFLLSLSLSLFLSLSLSYSLYLSISLSLSLSLYFLSLGGTAISKSIFLEISKKQGPSDFIFLVAAVDHAVLLKRMITIKAETVI